MGWKSSQEITRPEAEKIIIKMIMESTDAELSAMLADLGVGDKPELPYYGYNLSVSDQEKFNL